MADFLINVLGLGSGGMAEKLYDGIARYGCSFSEVRGEIDR